MSDCLTWASTEISPEQFEHRLIQARRNGFAAWLWPDIDSGHWRSALDEIVRVARKLQSGESKTELACDDGKAMCVAAYSSGMGPLLGLWIENGMLQASGDVRDMLLLHLFHNRRRMARLAKVLRETVGNLDAASIAPVILKGMDTAFRYFPEPGVRPLSDIDMLVPAASIPQAEQILSRSGYRRVPRTRAPYACDFVDPTVRPTPKTLTLVHEDDPWSIDILATLDKRLPTGRKVAFDALRSRTQPADWLAGAGAQAMRQPLLALYLAVHLSQTLLNATVLRALELVLVIRRDAAEGTLDWSEFVQAAKVIGGARLVYPALVFVEQLAPGIIPAGVMEAATADASKNLRDVVVHLDLATAQPLDRHSVRERFMWATNWREVVFQIASELSLDGRGKSFEDAIYSIGTKLWALRRRRYST